MLNNRAGFVFYLSIFIFCISLLAKLISQHVPTAFMDEIFHVPQAQEYFRGNWRKWDPMITTPPGLYILSVSILKALKLSDEIFNFRLVNLLFGVGIFSVSRAICSGDPLGNERAFLIALLPNLFIFYGLYYTDSGSVFFVLLAHWALKRNLTFLFLLASVISLGFRQTNIIWTALFCVSDNVCRKVDGDLRILWRRKTEFTKEIGSFITLCVIFALALYFNGGSIVLGDKASHASSLHLAQLFYCTTFIFVMSWPLLIGQLLNLGINWTNLVHIVFLLSLNVVCYGSVRYGTIFHRYLVADNRHWTNFIWRRVLSEELIRNSLIPLHAFGVFILALTLKQGRGLLWTVGYLCTCGIVLIPSPLIEPRYYILPFVFFLLNVPIASKRAAFYQIFAFMAVNLFIVGYFLYCPFTWPSNPSQIQRRIW